MNFAIEIKPSGELLLAIHDLADAIREHAAATNRAATAAELAVSRPVPVARQQVDIPTPSVVAKPIQVDALLPPVPGHRVHLLPDAPPLAFGASDSRLLTDARRVLLRELYPAGVAGTVIMASRSMHSPGRRFDSPDVAWLRHAPLASSCADLPVLIPRPRRTRSLKPCVCIRRALRGLLLRLSPLPLPLTVSMRQRRVSIRQAASNAAAEPPRRRDAVSARADRRHGADRHRP